MSNNFKRYLKSFVLLCIFLSVVSFQGDPTFAREFQDSVCERAKGLNQTDQAIADCPELALLDYPAEILFPTSAGGPDAYGYTWNDSVTMDWKEIISSGGGVQIFPLPNKPDTRVDDMVVGPFPLGFNFKFYENEYSQIYISSNGLIGFSEDFAGILAGASNLTIPFDYRIPQNFVAPFWDDLIIGGEFNIGKVAYGAGVDARGSYFVVEWSQVTKTNLQGSLTFEAILYASGDILFQYQTLNGDLESASVGIEDADGVDGLAYLVNAPGLSSNQAILFSRPSPAARVKLISSSPGAFNINRQSVHQILVRNTGSLGADVYDLMTSSNPPGWQILLLDSQGVELQDTDGDSIPDTGSLGQNETKEITVKIMAPAWAAPNSSVKVTLEARSSLSIFTSQWVELRSALPSQFALTYRRGLNVYLDLISYAVQYTAHEFKYYAGGTFAMAHASQNNFVGVSLVSGGSLYTNLEYMMVNSIGSTIFEAPRLLTENSGAEDVRDNAPVVVTAPNGNIGIAWVRRLTQVNANPRTNINIFFKILDPSGKTVILPETNVTQNLTWANTEDPVLKGFENLCVEAIEDTVSGEGRFHLAWIEKHTRNTGLITTDVAHIVYSDTGASIKTATIFNPINHSDKIDYFEPALVSYNNNQILLFYFVSDTNEPDDPIDSLVYARLDAGGYALQAQTYLYDVDGEKIDATQMSDGKVGLVWTNSVNEHVNAVILGSNLSKPADYIELTNPDGRPSRAVSIVNGLADQVILTWMDGGLLERLYYAVLNSNGEVVVAPIPFKYREGAPALETVAGLGNAEYLAQWIRYLPVVSR